MTSRGNRRTIIAAIVAGSVLLVTCLAVGGYIIIRNQQRDDDVKAADRAAMAFTKEVDAYRTKVSTALVGASRSDAKAMKAELEEATEDEPELDDAPEWGETHSAAYKKAVKTEKSLTDGYDDLEKVLDEAAVGQAFVKASRDALSVRTSDFVKSGAFRNGDPFRKKLIPGFEKALKTYDRAEVPDDGAELKSKVRAALKDIIKQAEKVADNLDAGKGGSIRPGTPYLTANTEVFSYESKLRLEISEAVTKATAKSEKTPKADAA